MRERKAYVFEKDGKFYAGVTFKDSRGIRCNLKKTAHTKAKAEAELTKVLKRLGSEGEAGIDATRMTSNQLVDLCESNYAKPAKFQDGRKVEGSRDFGRVRGFLKQFREYFDKMKIQLISYDDVREYRPRRVNAITHYHKPRTIATINRELASLRRVLNIAVRRGWIVLNTVSGGDS